MGTDEIQWILGNTFPCVVFGSFGSFWFALGITLTPYAGAFGDFAANPNGNPTDGLKAVGFNVGFGAYHFYSQYEPH